MPILGAQGSTKGPSTAPTIGTATAGNAQATVTFTAPSFSKLPITSYTVTASPGGATGTGASSPLTITGLSNGTAYTFTVRATNSNVVSAASSASNSATPVQPYSLGGVGPNGGRIFYDAGSTLSWGRYIEAANYGMIGGNDGTYFMWNTTAQTINGTSTGIGTAATNTSILYAICNTASANAWPVIIRNYGGGWQMPSLDEVTQMLNNRSYVNSLSNGQYWSSSVSGPYAGDGKNYNGYGPSLSSDNSVTTYNVSYQSTLLCRAIHYF